MSSKIAFLFPGQGAQSVGMCRSLYDEYGLFRDTIEEIEDLSYRKLWKMISEGPERDLKQTSNCQLALFAVCLATQRVVQFIRYDLKPTYCAGLSLGHYTALVAAKIMPLSEAISILMARAQFMQSACAKREGKMLAIIGLTYDQIQEVALHCPADCVVAIANHNGPQQIVVSGCKPGLAWFEQQIRQKGARRIIELDVAGAFHSPLMQQAATDLKPLLDTARLDFSPIKVVSNVTGDLVLYSDDFREELALQVTAPVMWVDTIVNLDRHGVDTYIEIGPGKVLQGLNRRIGTRARTFSVETVEDIAALP